MHGLCLLIAWGEMSKQIPLLPEYVCIESLVKFLREEGRTWPTYEEIDEFSLLHRLTKLRLRNLLLEAGCEPPKRRAKVTKPRGFKSNCHNRWDAVPTHSTWADGQIQGLSGADKSSLTSQHKL